MKKNKTKFIVRLNGVVKVVDIDYFATIKNYAEAVCIAMSCYDEFHIRMKLDAIEKCDSFIGRVKISKGLQRTIDELESRFPGVLLPLKGALLVDGKILARC